MKLSERGFAELLGLLSCCLLQIAARAAATADGTGPSSQLLDGAETGDSGEVGLGAAAMDEGGTGQSLVGQGK